MGSTKKTLVITACSVLLCGVVGFVLVHLTRRMQVVTTAEKLAGLSMRQYVHTQELFHARRGRYATPATGTGHPDLCGVGLWAKWQAAATTAENACRGYYYVDILERSGAYRFGLCGVPAPYPGSRLTYIVDGRGICYAKDTGGQPVASWPSNPRNEGWREVFDESRLLRAPEEKNSGGGG